MMCLLPLSGDLSCFISYYTFLTVLLKHFHVHWLERMKINRARRCLMTSSLLMILLLIQHTSTTDAFAPTRQTTHYLSYTLSLRIPLEKRDVSVSAVLPNNRETNDDAITYSACRSAFVSTLMGLVLLTSPPSLQQHQHIWTPLPAFALEVVSGVASVDDPSTVSSPEDIVVGIPPLPKQEKTTLDLLLPSSPEQKQQPISIKYSPVEEVWTLIDKYYIDKSFNGQVCCVVLGVQVTNCHAYTHLSILLTTR